MAAKSSVAQNTISQLERRERKAMPSTVRKLADALGVEPSALLVDALTPREREVLNLIAQGHSNSQIAEELSTSLSTVKHHVKNLMTKLGDATLEASRQREVLGNRGSQQSQQDAVWKTEEERVKREIQAQEGWHEPGRWAEYYVSGEALRQEMESTEELIETIRARSDEPLSEEHIGAIRAAALENESLYLSNIIPALLSYPEDLTVARSRLVSDDPKETIEAAQLVLRRAKKIVEEYDSKLQSLRRIPEHYYADPSAHLRILDVQKALARQRIAAAEAVQELMDLYDECLDTLEDQIIGMRKESDVLDEFVTQAHDWER